MDEDSSINRPPQKSARLPIQVGVVINLIYTGWLIRFFLAIPAGTEIRPMGVSGLVGIISILMFTLAVMPTLDLLNTTGTRLQGALVLLVYLFPLPIYIGLMTLMSHLRGFTISE